MLAASPHTLPNPQLSAAVAKSFAHSPATEMNASVQVIARRPQVDRFVTQAVEPTAEEPTFQEKALAFCKGLVAPITETVTNGKNLAMAAGALGVGFLLNRKFEGKATPYLIGGGLVLSGIQVLRTLHRLNDPEQPADHDKKEDFYELGAAVGGLSLAVAGANMPTNIPGLTPDTVAILNQVDDAPVLLSLLRGGKKKKDETPKASETTGKPTSATQKIPPEAVMPEIPVREIPAFAPIQGAVPATASPLSTGPLASATLSPAAAGLLFPELPGLSPRLPGRPARTP
jgi:hypothetical protein